MSTRRRFLGNIAAAGGALALQGITNLPIQAEPVTRVSKPLRILILGGTGFVGPHLVHVAVQRGHHVAMLNRGRREPTVFEADFAKVQAFEGDRATPTGYDALKGTTWDVVIETSGYRHTWTQEAAQFFKASAGRYLYISSTGVYWPYHQVDLAENGRVLLEDTPPQPQPTYGVMKALSENEVRSAFGDRGLIIRPGYIVGPGDTTDRWTYWPVRIARGGEILVPGKPTDQVQYIDVRDLSEWMIRLLEDGTGGTFNAVGPARRQTMQEFVYGVAAITSAPLSWTWIEDYEWLGKFPLNKASDGTTSGLNGAIPWVAPLGDELGHMRIDHRKALAAGLTYRPLAVTAADTLAWRNSDAVPQPLRDAPRYVLKPEQELAILEAWKKRA